jgi:glutamate-ammonia-ligase adenylyltransferase
MPLMVVSDHLTELAEVILAAALDMAWSQMTARYGRPVIRGGGRDGEAARFAVIGYGKLGGIELGYGSDLDLVFVFASPGEQVTDGERSLSHQAFFLRLAQRLIHVLSTQTGAGRAYEVDMRLRPSGQAGLLVSHIDAFTAYQRDKAWTWEHQALVRARPVAGDRPLGREVRALREELLLRPRDPGQLRREVVEMRRKMRENLERRNAGELDLKQTPGGLVDIEFLAQYAVLRHARECRELLIFTDTIRILETLESGRLLDYPTTKALTDAYRAYRKCVHAASLQRTRAMIGENELAAERAAVRRVWADWLQ